jgi:6-phosphogluconolactonase
LNQVSSQGGGPCHLLVEQTGKTLLVANYGGGSIAALPIKDDGSLAEATSFIQHEGKGVNKQRQEGPHAHFITTDPANRFALTCDLGLDKVLVYRLDAAAGKLVSNDPPSVSLKPGSGPRHLAFHPNGRFAYVINEMGNTLSAFAWQAGQGSLAEIQSISTLPEDFKANSTTAEVEVHPSGKFVYGSNRGHDSIVVFSVDPATGKLAFVEHQSTQGKMPRHFIISPNGKFLIAENQGSDSILVYKIDLQTGRLTPTGQTLTVGAPVCVKFVTK